MAIASEQLQFGAVVTAAGRQVVAAVLADLDRELAAEDARRTPYRLHFHERSGLEYATRVGSRHESLERADEALAANPDLDFVDVLGPSGDWLTRVGREPASGRLVCAPATDHLSTGRVRKRAWRAAQGAGAR
jgi:hypothetical protein